MSPKKLFKGKIFVLLSQECKNWCGEYLTEIWMELEITQDYWSDFIKCFLNAQSHGSDVPKLS